MGDSTRRILLTTHLYASCFRLFLYNPMQGTVLTCNQSKAFRTKGASLDPFNVHHYRLLASQLQLFTNLFVNMFSS